jgi:hypothetical protein
MIATNEAHDREALATFARTVAERCAREKYLDDFLLWAAGTLECRPGRPRRSPTRRPARSAPPDSAAQQRTTPSAPIPGQLHAARKRRTASRPITAAVNHVPGPKWEQCAGTEQGGY